jgi:hypothetical protein
MLTSPSLTALIVLATLRRFHRTRLAGIDIAGLPYVINMTLPDPVENYVHRVGRVGRADCIGLAISIVATAGIKEKVGGGRSMLACLRCASLTGPCPAHATRLVARVEEAFLRLEGLSYQKSILSEFDRCAMWY